jgi:hypothetical protein
VLRGLVRLIQPLFRSVADCGEFMSCALLDAEYGKGWHLMDQYGRPASATKQHAEARAVVWAHTQSVLDRLLKRIKLDNNDEVIKSIWS